jgi:hypothetical protein
VGLQHIFTHFALNILLSVIDERGPQIISLCATPHQHTRPTNYSITAIMPSPEALDIEGGPASVERLDPACLSLQHAAGQEGRHYIAGAALSQTGTLVWREHASAHALFDGHRKRACAYCLLRTTQVPHSGSAFTRSCQGACAQVYYCSEACQQADASAHAPLCGPLRRLATLTLGGHEKSVVKMVLVLLFKLHAESGMEEGAKLAALESHYLHWDAEELAGWRKAIAFVQSVLAQCASLPAASLTEADIGLWISRVESNSFGIWWNDKTCMGRALCLQASFFNHSCSPNLQCLQAGVQMEFRTLRPIALGEPLTITYISCNAPLAARRRTLRSDYFFTCHCSRCEAEEASGGSAGPLTYTQKHVHVKKGPPKKKKLEAKGHVYDAPMVIGITDKLRGMSSSLSE